MQDQVDLLHTKGVKAVYIGSAHAPIIEEIKDGKFQVLFFSPECLLTELDWRDVLHSKVFQEQLAGFIVDEAHCVNHWYAIEMTLYLFIQTTSLIFTVTIVISFILIL